jgi:diguanylate cyclase (GGDEF)-like protein
MSSDTSHNSSPTAPFQEPERNFWTQTRRFSARMEAAYQAEVERMREFRIERTGLAAVALYGAFAISDRVMIPDAWETAWAIRFLLVVPLMLACTFGYRRLRQPLRREIVLAAAAIVTGASLPLIAALSMHANAAHYQIGITLVVLFGNIILAQRFRGAVVTSVVLGLVYAVTLHNIDSMPPEVAFNNWLFFFAAVVISLIANAHMDQDRRRAYLARARELERNRELSEAVQLLERLSSEDALTKLPNRREFDRRLALEWGRAQREVQTVALILVDVDCFKAYNDHYGHPAGDACLQRVAEALASVPQRSSDLTARFGGEEFVVLLPDTSVADALKIAERMRAAVTAMQLRHEYSVAAAVVTASFGVAAMMPTPRTDPAELLAHADAALYRAKADGRNCVAEHTVEDIVN